MVKRADALRRLFRHRFDIVARHPGSKEAVDGVEDLDEAAAGPVIEKFLDEGFLVDVRDNRRGRVSREVPVTKIGVYRRKRLEEQLEAEQREAPEDSPPD